MGWFEAIVVFTLAWWCTFLPILSAGTRSHDEDGAEKVRGADAGARSNIRMPTKLLIATGVAALITFAVWLVQAMGWFNGLIPDY